MKTIRIIIAGVLLFLLGMAWAAESQPPTPDFITVQDVKGQCWQIKPRNFYMKGGMFAFQNTVIFERTSCK